MCTTDEKLSVNSVKNKVLICYKEVISCVPLISIMKIHALFCDNVTMIICLVFIHSVTSLPNPQPSLERDYFDDPTDALVPYSFMFNHNDGFGTTQHREENKNEDGVVRGSYGYRGEDGLYRHVSYIANKDGFHAVLRTNEPGVENKNSADVAVIVQ